MVVPLIVSSYDIQDSSSISSPISSVDSSSSTSSSSSSLSSQASSSEPVDLTNYHEATYSHVFNQNEFSETGYVTTAGTSEDNNGLVWNYDAFTFLVQSSNGI